MMYRTFGTLAAVSLMLASTAALAQTKPKPASALVITNARAVPATDVAISVGADTVRLSKPLAAEAKATLKLPKISGCMVAISASFEDEATVELDEFDVCKEKTIRFTN
jgi:hypothetical protein